MYARGNLVGVHIVLQKITLVLQCNISVNTIYYTSPVLSIDTMKNINIPSKHKVKL